MQKYEQLNQSRRSMMVNNFLGGISWGVGSVLGATLIIGIIGILITRTQSLPIVGDVVHITIQEIEKQTGKPLFEK